MKYLKTFEENKSLNPEIGDYVIIKLNPKHKNMYANRSYIINAIENTIGRVVPRWNSSEVYTYKVNFSFGKNIHRYYNFDRDEILDFSKNSEDLNYYLQSKKYNL